MTATNKKGAEMKATLVKEKLYYASIFLADKYSPTVTLLTRRYRLYELPRGKTRSTVMCGATDFPAEEELALYIEENGLEELPDEADGNLRYAPDEFSSDQLQQVYK